MRHLYFALIIVAGMLVAGAIAEIAAGRYLE